MGTRRPTELGRHQNDELTIASINTFKPDAGDTATDIGLSALLGLVRTLASGHRAMAEIRAGLIDSPGFKLTFGYTLF